MTPAVSFPLPPVGQTIVDADSPHGAPTHALQLFLGGGIHQSRLNADSKIAEEPYGVCEHRNASNAYDEEDDSDKTPPRDNSR